MKFVAKVYEPMYEFNSKKYIRFIIPPNVSGIIERMRDTHTRGAGYAEFVYIHVFMVTPYGFKYLKHINFL